MGIHRSNANSQSSELLSQNGISLVNKGQNILHKLSLGANSMVIYLVGKYRTRCLQIQINIHLVSEYCQTTSMCFLSHLAGGHILQVHYC